MNLTSIREKIKNLSDYSPDLAQFNNQVDNLINDAYYYVWTYKRWLFTTKEILFDLHPDMLPTRDNENTIGGVPNTANVAKGSREVSFLASMDRLLGTIWEGQVIEIQGLEYGISKVLNDSTLYLDQPFLGTTASADSTWVIKKRWYDLPQDTIELLSMAHRDQPAGVGSGLPPYGKMIGLMPRADETMNLRVDYKASYAEAYVLSPFEAIPSGEKLSWQVADTADTTAFPVGTYLEVCWAFEKDGKIGPLSQPEIISFTAQEQGATHNTATIKFLSWDDQSVVSDSYQTKDTMPSQYEGYRKQIFWNANFNRTTGERIGLPCWKTFNIGGTTRNSTTYLDPVIAADTSATITISYINQIDSGNERYIEYDGQHVRVRPYPRPDGYDLLVKPQAATVDFSKVPLTLVRKATMRYYKKPTLLTLPTDTPEMPNEFHQLIVYRVMEDIYFKLGSTTNAQVYTQKIEKEMKNLQKRYCDIIDFAAVRSSFGIGTKNGFLYDYSSVRKLN